LEDIAKDIAKDFEKLGVFYLGRRFDVASARTTSELLLYESRDLLTHAVCIGMTGSGKTGLCLTMVEEAAIDSVPVIAIDPKGDLANLLLTFPNLSAQEFRPWINEEEARLQKLSADEFAAQQAQLWTQNLRDWGQTKERIEKLHRAADFRVFTPGSSAGLPISIVQTLEAPAPEVVNDADAFRDLVASTASCLLSLVGTSDDPLRSREHILLSNILSVSWKNGKGLSLAQIIEQIQKPPLKQVGAIDIESFFPAKERFDMAMSINNLLAAPGFDAWLTGQPLKIESLLYSSKGKPQVSIISIAHLSDAERMFIVSLLLTQLVCWMRSQTGTSSLRAILYMDEIFGYLPPVKNPPSKLPLLTLLKQARAYGLGLLLASQNPVDLDYKALANSGTWFIGRLQTERDKMRVLDGLQSAVTEAGADFNRGSMEQIIAGLGRRQFLMNNVHDKHPEVFETRWTMSYLRGPLSRAQIKVLMDPVKKSLAQGNGESADTIFNASKVNVSAGKNRPALPPDVREFFRSPGSGGAGASSASETGVRAGSGSAGVSPVSPISYKPYLFVSSMLHFVDAKKMIDQVVPKSFIREIITSGDVQSWSSAQEVPFKLEELSTEPLPAASFAELPSPLAVPKNYKMWTKEVLTWLEQTQRYYLLYCQPVKTYSLAGETEVAFRIRLQQKLSERRDEQTRKLKDKFLPKLNSLQEKIQAAQSKMQSQLAQSREQEIDSVINVGATILGAMIGRKPLNTTTVGRATSAARGAGRASRKKQEAVQAGETAASLQAQLEEMNRQFQADLAQVAEQTKLTDASFETVAVAPKKANIEIRAVGVLWLAYSGSAGVPPGYFEL